MQCDAQLAIATCDVGGGAEELVQQGASFVVGTGIVRAAAMARRSLSAWKATILMMLVKCLRSVASLTTAAGADVADLDSLGQQVGGASRSLATAIACRAQLLAELAVGDLEAAHGGRRAFGVVDRRGAVGLLRASATSARAARICLVERRAARGWARCGWGRRVRPGSRTRASSRNSSRSVLEEVLLSPTLEHAIGDLDVGQVPAVGDDLGLVAIVGQSRDLPQPQLAFEEAHRLVVQSVLDRAAVELRAAEHEASLVDATGLALAIGEDVEAGGEELLEQLGAPAAAVEHDSDAALAYEAAAPAQEPWGASSPCRRWPPRSSRTAGRLLGR